MASEGKWTNLYPLEVFKHPWLKSFLGSSTSRVKAIIFVWVVWGVLPLLVFIITSNVDGSFQLEGDAIGFADDAFIISFLFIIPAVFSGVAFLFPRFTGVLHSLEGVISKEDLKKQDFNSLLEKYEENINGHRRFRFLAVGVVVIGMLFFVLNLIALWSPLSATSFDKEYWASRTFSASFAALSIYYFFLNIIFLPYILFKLFSIAHIMRSICIKLTKEEWIRVYPLNPDKAGGLGEFGRYSFRIILVGSLP